MSIAFRALPAGKDRKIRLVTQLVPSWRHRPEVWLLAFMSVLALGLLGLSLQWPIIGDAAIFHFAAVQFMQGATPYRDFVDMNVPLIYAVHAAIIAVGGPGDGAFRVFDLAVVVTIGLQAARLVRPEGWAVAALASVTLVTAHLLFGPTSAGERDYLVLVPVLAAASLITSAAETQRHEPFRLFCAGVAIGSAMLLKPTAIVLLALPMLGLRPTVSRVAYGLCGAALPLALAALMLLQIHSLSAFLQDQREFTPYYAAIATRPWIILVLVAGKQALLGSGGLLLAACLGWSQFREPRPRILAGLVGFGLIHFLGQGKGFFYHAYPLIAGLTVFGAWALPSLSPGFRKAICLVSLVVFAFRGAQAISLSLGAPGEMMPTPVTLAMSEALSTHLSRGARVEMLDMSGGAFLAMARTHMRQATPFAYWAFLDPGKAEWRADLITMLRKDPPDAILLTDANWPTNNGFAAVDEWPDFNDLLVHCYQRVEDQRISSAAKLWSASSPSVSWRLYLPVKPVPDGCRA